MFYRKAIKRYIKSANKWFHKYINGWKGSVSIFLALITAPFLSIALVVFESARYQSVVEMMNELIDSAGLSTLAEYDTYLEDRFGLLATAPVGTSGVTPTNVNSRFKGYLDNNIDALGNSVTIKNSSANGKYALSDTAVLRSQLLEYGELSATTELVTEGIDLDEIIDYLMSANDTLENFNKSVKTVKAGASAAKDLADIVDSINELKELGADFKKENKEYKEAYSKYSSKADECKEELDKCGDDSQRISEAMNIVNESAKTYKEKASDCKSSLSDIKSKMGSLTKALNKILEDLQDTKDNYSVEENLTNDLSDNLFAIVDQAVDTLTELAGDDFADECNNSITALDAQITLLNKICNKTDTNVKSDVLNLVDLDFAEDVENTADLVLKRLGEKSSEPQGEYNMFFDLLDSILGFHLFYDSRLNAKVSSSYLYTNSVDPSYTAQMLMQAMTKFQKAGQDFCDSFSGKGNFLSKIKKFLKGLAELFEAIADLILTIVTAIADLVNGVINLLKLGDYEFLQHLILYSYGVYNMPNRTTFEDGKSLSGYSYSKIYDMAGGSHSNSTLFSIDPDPHSTITMFKGAEGEYLLSGTTDEAANQEATFYQLFLCRLLFNLYSLGINPQISKEGISFLLCVLIESFLDTFILVNGGNEYLIKISADSIYTTPSGIKKLWKDLVNTSSASDNLKAFISGERTKEKTESKGEDKGKPPKGLFSCSYSEHLLLLLVFCTPESSYLQRMQNLIQLEAAENYKNTASFRLSNTYTYVETNVDYQLNPLFKLDSLTGNGLLESVSRRYHGY